MRGHSLGFYTALLLTVIVGIMAVPQVSVAAEFVCQRETDSIRSRTNLGWFCPAISPTPNNCVSRNDNDLPLLCQSRPQGYTCTDGGSWWSGRTITCNPTPVATDNQPYTNPNCPPNMKPGELCYTPLEPLPGVDQTGGARSLQSVLNFAFRTLFTIGGFLAVLFLILGGITYMVSDVVDKKSEAKKRIQGALMGLLLLILSYLILSTINPELLKFNLNLGSSNSNIPVPAPANTATSQAELDRLKTECESAPRNGSWHAILVNGRQQWVCT